MDAPELKLISDETLNDSDKVIFTVPDGEVYELLWIYVEFTTTATVGNRLLDYHVRDADGDVVEAMPSSSSRPANATTINRWLPGEGYLSQTGRGLFIEPLPSKVLIPSGFSVRIFDVAAIDAAADDLIVHALVQRHFLA